MTAGNNSMKSTRREIIALAGAAAAAMTVTMHQAVAASGSDNLGSPNKPLSKPSKTTMSDPNTISLEDHAAIEAMLLHIFWLADHGHLDQVADFHTQDALVTSNAPPPYDRMQGREAVREVGIKNPTPPGAMTRHIMTALQVTPNKDGSVATTCTVLRFSRSAESPLGMCLLEDSAQTLIRGEDGGWLISKRHVDILFPLAPGGGPRPGATPGAPPGSPPGAAPGNPNHN
jgi:SnoaL-like domain